MQHIRSERPRKMSLVRPFVAVTVAAGFAASLAACGEAAAPPAARESLTIGVDPAYIDIPFDPLASEVGYNVVMPSQAVYESLIIFDE